MKKTSAGYLLLSFWIGDGGIFVLNGSGEPKLFGKPDSGQYAGQTRFLDSKLFDESEIYERVNIKMLKDFKALILATDGITDAWFETEALLEDVKSWKVLWAALEKNVKNPDTNQGLKDLTSWMDFWSVGNHDDRTITITLPKE